MSATAQLPLPADRSSEVFRGTARPELLRDETLAELLEAAAARTPEATALIFGDTAISYAELDRRADLAAAHLIDAGAAPGKTIGLWVPRGIELLIAQLAITKTGAAWLPFDAGTPVERIAVCLADAQAIALVAGDALLPRLDTPPVVLACPILVAGALAALRDGDALVRARPAPSDPAYLIYTSGSTGTPKGIAISQRSICHFLRSENALLGVRAGDRVYQGFSVAFDMSFEEIWISYLVGATLWIAPDTLAGDPEALPQALIDAQIDVLHAVPTLLALFASDVPNLRLINLGGEACPEALVSRWARPGRLLFNTYGPTETTVTASLAALMPGEPVTIGRPLPNYSLMIVDPEVRDRLALLPRGASGELCVGGPGVALGYAGRPELTAEKFVADPEAPGERIYRTGDLAAIDEAGDVRFYGRVDDQIKIRGFRVELGEIEIALAAQPGVSTAAVVLRQDAGIDQLVAFYVADPQAALPASTVTLRTALAARLPPYMVPGRFLALDAMPRLASGKIDRRMLRAQPLPRDSDGGESDLPETEAQKALFAALGQLFAGQTLRRDSDFFDDLGGHSLLAARLASMLRVDPRYARLTLRDLYQHRRLDRIAEAMAALASAAVPAARTAFKASPVWRRWTCGAAQAVAIPLLVALNMMQWLAPFFTYHFYTGDPGDSIANAVAMSVAAFVCVTLATFGVTIAGKWLVLGRARPGRYPLWGLTYYRWWLVDRLIDAAPSYLLPGSSLHAWYLRALGARVGDDSNLASLTIRVPDLLTIGDCVNVGEAVNFENARVEGGELILGRIDIADHGYVGSYAVMEGGSSIGEYGHLDPLSALSEGEHVPALRIFSGSPARDAGAYDPAQYPPRPQAGRAQRIGEGIFFLLGALAVSVLFFLPVFPSFALIDHFDSADGPPEFLTLGGWLQLGKYFLYAFPASAILIVLTALIAAGIRWAVLPRLVPGRFPVHGRVYLEKWLVNQIQENSLQVLHGVYATVFSPFWYRLLGAKVGRDTEISTAQGVVPDMLELGDDCFIADAVLLGDEEIDGGWMTLKPTVISRRSFVGNGAYVPDGTVLPEDVLIGVHSRVPPNEAMRSGETWLGSPPIRLPAREQTQGYAEALTFRPSPWRRLARAAVEAFRIVTPHAIVIAAGYGIVLNLMPAAAAEQWGSVIWGLTLSGLVFGLGAFVFVALLKWLFVGRYVRTAAPMWTWFVWSSEAVTNLYEGIAVPNFVRYLRGTPWLPLALNLLGARIGKGVYLDTTDITEFDCVTIGDHSELNALCGPQTHLFEDRVMKIDQVRIGARVTIGPRSIVLYSASVADDARLGALTLVMKGERIPEASDWQGCPAAPA